MLAAAAGMVLTVSGRRPVGPRKDLLQSPRLQTLLRGRAWQLMVSGILLAGLAFTILAGLLGTPVGNRNFAMIFVWIVWWAGLFWIAVPLLGRSWCSVCPLPLPGE